MNYLIAKGKTEYENILRLNSQSNGLPFWHPQSWRNFNASQQPEYTDLQAVKKVRQQLESFNPLISSDEIDVLRAELAIAESGNAFILQAGDCAERFLDCTHPIIQKKLEIIFVMSEVLSQKIGMDVIKIGRLAGQYAKPRSQEFEITDQGKIPSYRGDIINSYEASHSDRIPDPSRMISAYHYAYKTLESIRRQEKIFYVSHEGLLLEYESALTRFIKQKNAYYNLSAHTLWIGDRTRSLEEAHIEYFRGIQNPVGIKIGPQAAPEEIAKLCQILNPKGESGKLILITRLGAKSVAKYLPNFIAAVQKVETPVLWNVDPMHGNHIRTQLGIKTREFNDIFSEIEQSFVIHQQHGSVLSGVHFELTSENVTECLGGSYQKIKEEDLVKNYESYCDPRLNYRQSLEMAEKISLLF